MAQLTRKMERLSSTHTKRDGPGIGDAESCGSPDGENTMIDDMTSETDSIASYTSALDPIQPDATTLEKQRIDQKHDTWLEDALDLVKVGAARPSCCESSPQDLQATPSELLTSVNPLPLPGLWPHQRASVGRMIMILSQYFCALLAFQMGLGKTLIIIGECTAVYSRCFHLTRLALLVQMGLTRAKRDPVLIVVPRALLGQWKSRTLS
jgi:SNF2 family DNA or RNA helicase